MLRQMAVLIVLAGVLFMTACQSNTDPSSRVLPKEKNAIEKAAKQVNNQLILAAENGDTEQVLNLLEEGADVNAVDDRGRTAVVAATYANKGDTVKALIEQGADINIRDNNLNNVLLYAGASGYLDIVKHSLAAGADTTLTNRFGGTALIPASDRGHVEVVKELLEHSDTDVNHMNNLHWTELMEAVILGDGGERYQTIVKLLLDHGADVHIGDSQGITPLQHAQKLGFEEIESLLREAG